MTVLGMQPAHERATVIAVAVACHNRREKTRLCLEHLAAQRFNNQIRLDIFLVDDGCTDGTTEMVRASFPMVHVIPGDGTLYWNGGMRRAIEEIQKQYFDHILLLNDDTYLDDDALDRMVGISNWARQNGSIPGTIVVGTTVDPVTTRPTYGGSVKGTIWHPLKFTRVRPGDSPVRCDTFNGNCVLLDSAVVERLGNLDGRFVHLGGDTEYGLRARRAGIPMWVCPGRIGTCEANADRNPCFDRQRTVHEKLQWINDPRGFPIREWRIIARGYGGPFWRFFWLLPYAKFLVCAVTVSTAQSILGLVRGEHRSS